MRSLVALSVSGKPFEVRISKTLAIQKRASFRK